MPECAEVKLFVNSLNARIKSKPLDSIEIVGGRFLRQGLSALDIIKFPLHNALVSTKGKFIYWSFREDVVFFNTLGMTGSFGKLNKHSALKFNFGGDTIYFNDIRRFGTFKISNKLELQAKLNSLGWDPFIEPEIPNWLIDKIRQCNHKTIAEVIMNQSIFCGAGNYIKNEILYKCKIHPNQLVLQLTDVQIIELAQNFKIIANDALEMGGATIATYANMDGVPGRYSSKFKVYGKKLDPDNNPVTKIKTKDGRSSFYVEKVQII